MPSINFWRQNESSLEAEAKHQRHIIRGHWGIENRVHWQLDVTFHEDYSRVRKDNGAENLSVLRRCTLNILRGDESQEATTASRHESRLSIRVDEHNTIYEK